MATERTPESQQSLINTARVPGVKSKPCIDCKNHPEFDHDGRQYCFRHYLKLLSHHFVEGFPLNNSTPAIP